MNADRARPSARRDRRRGAGLGVAVLGLVLLGGAAPPASAQSYPSRPVRLIVPFPPGGGNDIVGRILALRLSESFGVPVVVDNRGGAGGTIGTEIAAKAAPDGHTMLVNNISLAVNATLVPNLPYDTLKDFAPVTLLGRQPNLVVVNPALPARSVPELLALARAKSGMLNFGSGGIGTASHLAAELLQLMSGTKMVHVPYKGLAPALTDLAGGRLQLIISTLASALPHLKGGRLRALAVTASVRSVFFPELPTMEEAGVRGYEFSTWYGLLVPGRTPGPIVQKLYAAVAGALRSPGPQEQFAAQGLEPTPSTPGEFRGYLAAEIAKWGRVIRASGARPD